MSLRGFCCWVQKHKKKNAKALKLPPSNEYKLIYFCSKSKCDVFFIKKMNKKFKHDLTFSECALKKKNNAAEFWCWYTAET